MKIRTFSRIPPMQAGLAKQLLVPTPTLIVSASNVPPPEAPAPRVARPRPTLSQMRELYEGEAIRRRFPKFIPEHRARFRDAGEPLLGRRLTRMLECAYVETHHQFHSDDPASGPGVLAQTFLRSRLFDLDRRRASWASLLKPQLELMDLIDVTEEFGGALTWMLGEVNRFLREGLRGVRDYEIHVSWEKVEKGFLQAVRNLQARIEEHIAAMEIDGLSYRVLMEDIDAYVYLIGNIDAEGFLVPGVGRSGTPIRRNVLSFEDLHPFEPWYSLTLTAAAMFPHALFDSYFNAAEDEIGIASASEARISDRRSLGWQVLGLPRFKMKPFPFDNVDLNRLGRAFGVVWTSHDGLHSEEGFSGLVHASSAQGSTALRNAFPRWLADWDPKGHGAFQYRTRIAEKRLEARGAMSDRSGLFRAIYEFFYFYLDHGRQVFGSAQRSFGYQSSLKAYFCLSKLFRGLALEGIDWRRLDERAFSRWLGRHVRESDRSDFEETWKEFNLIVSRDSHLGHMFQAFGGYRAVSTEAFHEGLNFFQEIYGA